MEKWAGLSAGGKIRYLIDKAARRGAPATASVQHPRGQKDYPVTLLKHRLSPFNGKVTLVLDEESSRLYGNLGWDHADIGLLETHVLPGDHLTYIRKNAETAAAKLRELIRQASTHIHS